jgi:hypothetical protein
LLVTAVGITSLFALNASAALAEHWSTGTTLSHWKGALTVKAGGSSVTCSSLDMRVPMWGGEGAPWDTIPSGIPIAVSCTGGTTMEFVHEGRAHFTGGKAELTMWAVTGFWLESPFGLYFADPLEIRTAAFTNGSGLTPSKVTFSETIVGEVVESEAPLTISGTLTVTSSTGGLLTLVP